MNALPTLRNNTGRLRSAHWPRINVQDFTVELGSFGPQTRHQDHLRTAELHFDIATGKHFLKFGGELSGSFFSRNQYVERWIQLQLIFPAPETCTQAAAQAVAGRRALWSRARSSFKLDATANGMVSQVPVLWWMLGFTCRGRLER